MKTDGTVRSIHKLFGRLTMAIAWVSCILGFMMMDEEPSHQVAFALPLAGASVFLML
eukprot:COSAG06_NODE_10360_length_1695_cov_1.529449_3_plen_57_part_00